MIGEVTLGAFRYGVTPALVQSDPSAPPQAAQVLSFMDADGLEIHVPFVGEQWAAFQEKVAAVAAPTSIVVAPAGALPRL